MAARFTVGSSKECRAAPDTHVGAASLAAPPSTLTVSELSAGECSRFTPRTPVPPSRWDGPLGPAGGGARSNPLQSGRDGEAASSVRDAGSSLSPPRPPPTPWRLGSCDGERMNRTDAEAQAGVLECSSSEGGETGSATWGRIPRGVALNGCASSAGWGCGWDWSAPTAAGDTVAAPDGAASS